MAPAEKLRSLWEGVKRKRCQISSQEPGNLSTRKERGKRSLSKCSIEKDFATQNSVLDHGNSPALSYLTESSLSSDATRQVQFCSGEIHEKVEEKTSFI